MRPRRESRTGRDGRQCVAECAAFLEGRALELYLGRRAQPPGWAHLNWLAHARPTELIDRFRGELGLRRPAGTWAWATSALVGALVVMTGADEETIRLLQRDCLVPFELALLRGDTGGVLPEQVVAQAVPRLLRHPAVGEGEPPDEED